MRDRASKGAHVVFDAAEWFGDCGTEPTEKIAALSGPFAIDVETAGRERLLCIDRFAQETLCYAIEKGELRVAGRADLVAEAGSELNLQSVFDYLYFHAIPSPRTIFRSVRRLPPAHWARWSPNRDVEVHSYWRPRFQPASPRADFASTKAEFRRLLRDAVADALDGGKPGCFLSGGTDSSTVAGVIGQVCGRHASTYSIGFGATGYDEMAYARIAAKTFRTDHHEYYVTPEDLVETIPRVACAFDQPFGNSSALPAYFCAKMARDDGVTRLLAGDGGDELFGGNSRYAKQRVFDFYEHIPRLLRSSLIEPLLCRTSLAELPLLRKAASYVEQARLPMPARYRLYNLVHRLGVTSVLQPGFLARVDVSDPEHQQQLVWDYATADSTIDRTLSFDWRYTLAESDLPKVRGAAELAGIDVGFPMLDERLVEFSQQLPPDWKLRGLKLRWFFKEALRDLLPMEIIAKKKQGFGLPFGVWATQHEPLHALATDSLRGFATRGVVRPEFIRDLLGVRLHQHPGYFGEMVWILMMLEQWLRHHAPDFRVES
jgi:asparagine synthase (glutamine-hydrolysing)